MEGSLVGEVVCGHESDVNAIALACSPFQQVRLVAIDEGMVEKGCHAVTSSSRYDVKTSCVSRPP